MDKLLDELKRVRFFTKIELHSSYHLVCMRPDDIDKTMFCMHCHIKFLVIPFGLTNAPTTFQVLMNDLLKPFICCFVLVFFMISSYIAPRGLSTHTCQDCDATDAWPSSLCHVLLWRALGDVPWPHHLGRGHHHGSGEGGCGGGLATAAHNTCPAQFPGSYRVLPEVHRRLGGVAGPLTTFLGGLLMVSEGRHDLHGPQAGGDVGAPPVAARLRQTLRRQL